jgi:hypothetical protein
MIWPQSGRHSTGGQELAGHPRILGADQIDGCKDIEGAQGDVAKVAYGSRNNVEPGRKPGIDPEEPMLGRALFLWGIVRARSIGTGHCRSSLGRI